MAQRDQASEPPASTLVNRRGQRAIVRAADPARRREQFERLPPGVPTERRRRIPTLTGMPARKGPSALENDGARITAPSARSLLSSLP